MAKEAATQISKAAIGFEYCNKLFALERKWANLPDEQRRDAQQAKAESLLDGYWL